MLADSKPSNEFSPQLLARNDTGGPLAKLLEQFWLIKYVPGVENGQKTRQEVTGVWLMA